MRKKEAKEASKENLNEMVINLTEKLLTIKHF